MSDREKVMHLINDLPDNKIVFVLAYLQGLADGMEEVPDSWDLDMISRAAQENDGTTVDIHSLQ